MSTVEIARLIRTKELSAREALAAHLKQIERIKPGSGTEYSLPPMRPLNSSALLRITRRMDLSHPKLPPRCGTAKRSDGL